MSDFDVIVAGGGVAGLQTSLMLGRALRRVLVIDGGQPRNRFAAHMHGVLGNEGVDPAGLLAAGREEVAQYGVEVRGRRLGVLATSPMDAHRATLIRQWSEHIVFFAAAAHGLDDRDAARLRSRGVELVTSPVTEVLGEGTSTSGVRLEDGSVVEVDALFTGGEPVPHDRFVRHLGLERAESPMGSFLKVDAVGATSSGRIWAVGNVVNPAATVAMSMGAAAMTGGAVNMALVEEDFDHAMADGPGIGTLTR